MGLPPETADIRLRCQILGEEAELDEGADIGSQQGVKEVINVLEVENQAVSIAPAGKHVVMEESVKADVANPAMLGCQPEMFTPPLAQSLIGTSRPEAKAPVMRQSNGIPLGGKLDLLQG